MFGPIRVFCTGLYYDTVTSAGSGQPGDMFDVTAVLEMKGRGRSSSWLTAIFQ